MAGAGAGAGAASEAEQTWSRAEEVVGAAVEVVEQLLNGLALKEPKPLVVGAAAVVVASDQPDAHAKKPETVSASAAVVVVAAVVEEEEEGDAESALPRPRFLRSEPLDSKLRVQKTTESELVLEEEEKRYPMVAKGRTAVQIVQRTSAETWALQKKARASMALQQPVVRF